MIRVLFVDDEREVLSDLARMLRSCASRWDMTFVASGEAALVHTGSAPVDVIVTDMRMPCMTGAELLAIVRERHPEIIRIVLSGEVHGATALEHGAHDVLAKPCSPQTIIDAVDRACRLNADTR